MKPLLVLLAGLVAPVVTLFYRKGIWLTPDDPVSPFGCGTTPGASVEPFMQKLYARCGKFIGDWWWLGWRNSAYGLAYKWKPEWLKNLQYYRSLKISTEETHWIRKIRLWDPYDKCFLTETMIKGPFFHILYGYRLRPIRGTQETDLPVRPINMDGRPICSIRFGRNDD